jgi:predicted SAM-dependent methyltransferase
VGVLPRGLAAVPWASDIVIHDLRKPLPFGDRTACCVYTSHCLEHLTRDDGRRLVRECHRVLRKGGVVRVLVPDLFQLAERYVTANRASGEAAVEFLNDLDVFPVDDDRNPLLRVYRAMRNTYHKWLYDEPLLRQLLSEGGFSDVRRRGLHESAIEDIAAVETAVRFDKSMCVEASR